MKPDLYKLFDEFSLELYIIDAADLKFLYFNPAAARNIGYTLDELCGRSLATLTPYSSEDELQSHMSRLLHEPDLEEIKLTTTTARRDGSRYTTDVRIRLIDFDGRSAYVGLVQDSTEKQQALEQLYYVLKGASLGYWDWNVETSGFQVNRRWLEIFGYHKDELQVDLDTALELVAPQDRELVASLVNAGTLGDGNFTIEFRGVHKDPTRLLWILSSASVVRRDPVSGKALRVCGTYKDITRQKVQELEREEYLKFFNLSSDLMMIGKPDGTYTRVNPATLKVLGYSESELLAMKVIELVHPDDREHTRQELENQARGGESVDFVNRCVCKDGSLRYLSWRASFNHDDGLSYASARDITEHRRAEEELRRMQKLHSLGILAGGIAHDFNNILTVLFGNIALARSHLPAGHRSLESLDQAEKAFQRTSHLTSQLLTFAKGGDPMKEDVSIASYVEEVARWDLSGSQILLVFEAAPDLRMARVDKGQIAQVFSNLITNAKQAMADGGHLYVCLENVRLGAGSIPGLPAGDYLKCSVRDEGSGIDAANLDKIFDPYFTTRPQGSGLGLATVHSIVAKHGGHVSASSQPGGGSTFVLYLPAARQETATPGATQPASNQSKSQGSRILVMDDEAMIRELCARMLETQGHDVVGAADGARAVELYDHALQTDRPFDCLIMDLTIPGGMGGKEALDRILLLDPHARAIVASGYADDPIMANYRDYGFRAGMGKPFRMQALLEAVSRVLDER